MTYRLSNDQLNVRVAAKGAELQSLVDKRSGLEYIWQADPAVWGKHSPVLFPIVGTLKENRYHYQGQWYTLPRHGFARDMDFCLKDQSKDLVTLSLTADEETKKKFPFDFVFNITYTLQGDLFLTSYEVINPAVTDLLFSVGAHPAFNVPLEPRAAYENYELEFHTLETAPRWPITSDGLIDAQPQPFLQNARSLPLTKELFAKDALVFKHLSSQVLTLKSNKAIHGLDFTFKGFPYLGLWAANNAPFVCIEPWCGIADGELADQDLEHKEGIIRLEPGGTFNREWSVRVF